MKVGAFYVSFLIKEKGYDVTNFSFFELRGWEEGSWNSDRIGRENGRMEELRFKAVENKAAKCVVVQCHLDSFQH